LYGLWQSSVLCIFRAQIIYDFNSEQTLIVCKLII
jgi:hypothetical protein